MKSNITNDSPTRVTIKGSLEPQEVEKHKDASLKHLGKDVSLPGFRKGHVSSDVLAKHIGDGPLWQDMAERALAMAYPQLVSEHKLRVVGRPQVNVTKLAANNPLEFSITTDVLSSFELPDYESLAKEVNKKPKSTEVTDKEFEEALLGVRKQIAQQTPESKEVPPELTDEKVQELGPFKDVADFTDKFKIQILRDKEVRVKDKSRMEILEAILEKSDIKLPDVVVQSEIDKMMHQFKSDIERAGMKFEDYIKQADKTEEQLRDSWKPDAEKRARVQLIINEVAVKENIKPDEKEIEDQLKHLLEHHKDADKGGARIYIESMLVNEATLKFLESVKDSKNK